MEILTEVSTETIVEAIAYGRDGEDPIEIIMSIDQAIGDEGFIEDLLLRLAEAYEKEYISYEESMIERSLNRTFVKGADADRLELANIDLKYATSKREKLSKIVSILKSLDEVSDG